jgi:class 3 adenylate cyclase
MSPKIESMNLLKNCLIAFPGNAANYMVCIVDMVGSTKVTAALHPEKSCKYYSIFLNVMATIAEEFGAKIVKNGGDSLLFYFPRTFNPNEKSSINYSLECGLNMLAAKEIVNEYMTKEKLPSVKYRVSADYGTVMIATQANSSSPDIFGPPVNMCAKINHKAQPNEMVIGGDLYEIIKSSEEFRFSQVPGYDSGIKLQYPVYSVCYR